MTSIQIEEFQKLEMAYLDSVVAEDATKQIQMMELIFFWLRKQMRGLQGRIIIAKDTFETARPVEVSEMQKQEFTFLQIAMIKAVGKDDREAMFQVELKMREWLDTQLTESVNAIIKPKMRIIRDDEN
jgi:hypothetical protein